MTAGAGEPRERLGHAAEAVLESAWPGGSPASAADVDRVLTYAPAALRTSDRDAANRLVAALVWARYRAGLLEGALEIAESRLRSTGFTTKSLDAGDEHLLLAAATAFTAAGRSRRATPLALRAIDHARLRGDDRVLYRAHSVLALSRALNGEYESAMQSIEECHRIENRHEWTATDASYPVLVAQNLCAAAQFDSDRLRDTARQLRELSPPDPAWDLTARLTEAMALLIDDQPNRAVPLVTAVMNSSDTHSLHGIVRGFAVGIYADLLLGRGEATRTLSFLEGYDSPRGHVLCFDMQRAAAHLLLGEDRRALLTTEECARLGGDHCMRTIPPVLFRRAVAYERLSQTRLADASFEEGIHMVIESGSVTPLLTLPAEILHTLIDRLRLRVPSLSPELDRIQERWGDLPRVEGIIPLAALTPRERELATHLRSDKSFNELAQDLHVSVHTLRSQAQSLYGKLSVRSREEAVAALERAGYYV